MAATIEIFDGPARIGKTSNAFNCVLVKELMRDYKVNFSLPTVSPAALMIDEHSTFRVDGQYFDVVGIDCDSGNSNISQFQGEHVSSRLSDYMLPANYAFVGTVAQIAQDILNHSASKYGSSVMASTEFYVGNCADLGGKSFLLNNDKPVTAMFAIQAMKPLGVEVVYDNFYLHFPVKAGTGNAHAFKFGKDLVKFNRKWAFGNGWTYTADIVDLQRVPGYVGETFDVGDTITVEDSIRGDTTQKRIISYSKCLDDPRQDAITIGVFVRNSEEQSIAMSMDISAAQDTADKAQTAAQNSLQPGTSYNGVDISHEFGFRSTSADGLMRTFQNGTDGYLIQHLVGGVWKTVWQVTSIDGTTTAYSNDGNSMVVMGGSTGLAMYQSNGNGGWKLVGGMDSSGNAMMSKLFQPDNPQIFAMIGSGLNGADGGFMIFDTNVSKTECFFKVWYSAQGSTIISKTQQGDLLFCDRDNNPIGKSDGFLTKDVYGNNLRVNFKGGLFSGTSTF